MGTEPSRRRFAFLRYSLRGLLLTMALIGVGLVIFRWPWVEREVFTDPLGTPRRDFRLFAAIGGARPSSMGFPGSECLRSFTQMAC
jgi:hypothetical protein